MVCPTEQLLKWCLRHSRTVLLSNPSVGRLPCYYMWGKRERSLERELQAHLELEAEAQREAGLSPEQAGYAAQRAFGNTAQIREVTREMWGLTWLERFWQDLRYA